MLIEGRDRVIPGEHWSETPDGADGVYLCVVMWSLNKNIDKVTVQIDNTLWLSQL